MKVLFNRFLIKEFKFEPDLGAKFKLTGTKTLSLIGSRILRRKCQNQFS